MIRFKLKNQIGEKEFRERRRIPIQEIADETGINRMTLSKLLNHHGVVVRTDVLDKLCRYFACELRDLAEYVEDDPPESGSD